MMEWYHAFCQDDGKWYKQGFTDFPYPVAHEYMRLFAMLNDGEIYGCIFQVKDVFEVLIKHTVACLSALVAKNDDSVFRLFVDPLKFPALGDWAETIAASLAKYDVIKSDTSCLPFLKVLQRFFATNKIVNWRNETLGHGALAFKDDPEVIGALQGKIQLVSDFFRENAGAISSLMLYQGDAALKGSGCAVGDREVSMLHKGARVAVEPFIIADKGCILYFDSCRKDGSAYLDYANGKKRTVNHPVWRQKQNKFYSAVPVQSSERIESEIYLANVDDEINAVNYGHNYLKAGYMKEWVGSCLGGHAKGVFLLCAERGTGKSAFAYAIDGLGGAAVEFAGCTVRSYFMNRTLLRNAQDFISQVSLVFSLFKTADKTSGSIRSNRPEGLPRLNLATKTPKRDLAALLNQYRKIHEDKFGNDKLVLFIDGIDETTGEDLKLLEFIPETELLDEGVYIFFSCRSGDAFLPPLHVLQFIGSYPFTGSVMFDRRKENKALLEKYIDKYVLLCGQKLDAEQKEGLTAALDYRFTNLNILAGLSDAGYVKTFDELVDGGFLEKYFTLLELRYGSKKFSTVAEYIAVLGSLYEPVTVKELVSLVRDSDVEVGDLSVLSDLKCLVAALRSGRGTVYAIANVTYAQKVQSCFKAELQNVVQNFRKRVENYSTDSGLSQGSADALLYIAAYFSRYVADFGIDPGADFNFERMVEKLNNIATDIGRHHQKDYAVIRRTYAYGSIIEYYKTLIRRGAASNDQKLRYMLASVNSLRCFSLLKNYPLIEAYKEELLQIYDTLDEEGRKRRDMKQLIMALYADLSGAYGESNEYEKALAACRMGAALADELGDAYVKGICERNLCSVQRFRDADNAVKIAERIVSEHRDETGYTLAGDYLQLGQCYWMKRELAKAKENIYKALDVVEHSGEPRGIRESEVLVMVLWRVGQITVEAGDATLEEIDFARRSILSGLRYLDERIFAGNLGMEQHKARLLTSLALLYGRRYAMHCNANAGVASDIPEGDCNRALAAIATAEAIWKALEEAGAAYEIPSAILTCINYGYLLSMLQRFPEALEKVNEAIGKFRPGNPEVEEALRMALAARSGIQRDYDGWRQRGQG